MNRKNGNQKGFTLIEILIVIAIIGILAAVIVPRMGGFFSQGEEAAFTGEKNTLQSAVDAYFGNSGVERHYLGQEGPGLYPTYNGEGGSFPDVGDPAEASNAPGPIINMVFLMSANDNYDRGCIREGYISKYPKSACQLNGNEDNPGHYYWYVDSDGQVQAKYWNGSGSEWLDGYQDVYP